MALYPTTDLSFDIGDGPMLPAAEIMDTGRVPVEMYTSEAQFQFEKDLFGKVWLFVGRAEEIPNAGDWMTRDVDVRSVSALIVRGKDMKVRAFYNICSHRGMKLVWEAKGRGGKFACPYHAWMYDGQGALTNITDEKCFPHVDKKASGLAPIACEIWEGFVFINLAKKPRQTLREFLGPLAQTLAGAPFADYPYAATISQVVVGNWKLGMEAASEGYHVQTLHSRTVSDMLASKDNPHVNFPGWEPLGPHRTTTSPRNPAYRVPDYQKVRKFAFESAGQMTMVGDGTETPVEGFLAHPGVNRFKSPVFQSDQFAIFPNYSIHLTAAGWWTTSYWPLTKDTSLWRTTFYFKKPRTCREQFALTAGVVLNRDIFAEDNSCFQKQQKMLESGGKPFIQFGEQEILLRHLVAVLSGIEGQTRVRHNTRIVAA
jgi:phenylpropionate dioxygenase-like ring-hydroxylating dioxygenase large terminal subunit